MKKKSGTRRILAFLLAMCMVFSTLPEATLTALAEERGAGDEVEINEENFPDEIFRGYVSENFDTDKDGSLSKLERSMVAKIDVSRLGISSLAGIAFFEKVTNLNCSYNSLSSLDVNANTMLENLDCSNNNMNSLDVSGNTALVLLNCASNQLGSLDVSGCTSLDSLYCSKNNLSILNVRECAALSCLSCSENNLSSLDVSGNVSLSELYCHSNNLDSLNVSGCTLLGTIACDSNRLSNLDVSGCASLYSLFCEKNCLRSLNVSGCTLLNTISCYSNNLSGLDLRDCSEFVDVDAAGNVLCVNVTKEGTFDLSTLPGTFDVVRASNWTGGTVEGTVLTVVSDEVTYTYDCGQGIRKTFTLLMERDAGDEVEINEENFPDEIFRGYVSENFDTDKDGVLSEAEIEDAVEIDVSESGISSLEGIEFFENITTLNCSDNNLRSLDVSRNTKLEYLYCSQNRLLGLSVKNNSALIALSCNNNFLHGLIVSDNPNLKNISC